jgi:hypothetical protein
MIVDVSIQFYKLWGSSPDFFQVVVVFFRDTIFFSQRVYYCPASWVVIAVRTVIWHRNRGLTHFDGSITGSTNVGLPVFIISSFDHGRSSIFGVVHLNLFYREFKD